MTDKWKIRKKGYLKIYIAVNVKTKKILSMKVTNEHVHDSKALPVLVDDIIKSNKKITIGRLFADGAYEGNDIFRYLTDNGVLPFIKVRKNTRDKKEEIFLEIYLFWHRKMFYKSGRIAL